MNSPPPYPIFIEMAIEIHLYTEVFRRAGFRMLKVDVEGPTRLSEILTRYDDLSKVLKSLDRDGVPYIILVDGRYTRLDDDPLVEDGSLIKIFTPVSGGI